MSRVFVAHEAALGRKVVVKVLPFTGGNVKPISWLGVLLIVVGVVVLAMRISYTKDTETVTVGPVEVVAKRKAEIPPWVGILLIVGGGGLMVAGARRS